MLSAILFTIGTVGFMIRRNAIVAFMCVELMLNATNLALVAFSRMHVHWTDRSLPSSSWWWLPRGGGRLAIIVTIFHPPLGLGRRREPAVLKDCDAPTRGRDACAGNRFLHPGLAADRHTRRELRGPAPGRPAGRPLGAVPRRGCAAGLVRDRSVSFIQLLGRDTAGRAVSVPLYNWISSGIWQIDVGLLVDQLSILFVLLITGVGGLIHVYSIGYMAHDDRRRRFFAFLNLFVAAMLLLVLADNYLVLFVGWEGVGLRRTC